MGHPFGGVLFHARKEATMYWLNWLKAAGIRAVKTFAQTMLGMIAVGAAISEIQWSYVFSVAVVAAILSMLTSVAGLPELKEEKGENDEV